MDAQLPTFDGDKEKFQVWLLRFNAYASLCGFKAAIGNQAETDLPAREADAETLDPTKDADKKKLKAVERNQLAMANLTMAMSTEKVMSVVYEAKNADWPSGLAWKILKVLKSKYMMTAVELRTKLNNVHMSKNADPKKLFAKLWSIRNRYVQLGKSIDESDLIAVVMSTAPEKYQPLLISTQNAKGANLKLDDLETAMTQLYRAMSIRG